jgi:membrane-associated protein
MKVLFKFIDIVLHLDTYIDMVIRNYGSWTYLILFGIIFMETGLVVFPFLPGDSLLFAAGAFAARGAMKIHFLFLLLASAAIIGDTVNYWIGRIIGPKIFQKENVRLFKKEYLDRTHRFYEKYGAQTIIIARFIPIIRTFAPFVAGIGRMTYARFISYNVIGGTIWVAICVYCGYFFGNIPIVQRNFTLVILAIVLISVLPALIEIVRQRRNSKKSPM